MIERCHRTLIAAIMCRNNVPWANEQPIVLLGLRSVPKEDRSPANLVYGQLLRLPSDFFTTSKKPYQSDFVVRLKNHFEKLRPVSSTRHWYIKNVRVNSDLSNCSHVFIRTVAVRTESRAQNTFKMPLICVVARRKSV